MGNDAKKNGVGDVSSAKRLAEAAEQAAYAPLDPEMDIPDGFKVQTNPINLSPQIYNKAVLFKLIRILF